MHFNYITEVKKNVHIFRLQGRLIEDGQAVGLMDKIKELLEEDHRYFILDLSGLEYMNSTGLAILIRLFTKARNAGGEALICNVSKKVNELLLVTKLNTVFTVTETEKEAFEKLNLNKESKAI